jgi:hypothetical protein
MYLSFTVTLGYSILYLSNLVLDIYSILNEFIWHMKLMKLVTKFDIFRVLAREIFKSGKKFINVIFRMHGCKILFITQLPLKQTSLFIFNFTTRLSLWLCQFDCNTVCDVTVWRSLTFLIHKYSLHKRHSILMDQPLLPSLLKLNTTQKYAYAILSLSHISLLVVVNRWQLGVWAMPQHLSSLVKEQAFYGGHV